MPGPPAAAAAAAAPLAGPGWEGGEWGAAAGRVGTGHGGGSLRGFPRCGCVWQPGKAAFPRAVHCRALNPRAAASALHGRGGRAEPCTAGRREGPRSSRPPQGSVEQLGRAFSAMHGEAEAERDARPLRSRSGPILVPSVCARRFPDTPAVFWARPIAPSRVSLTPVRGEGRSASPFCIPGARREMGRTGLGEVAGVWVRPRCTSGCTRCRGSALGWAVCGADTVPTRCGHFSDCPPAFSGLWSLSCRRCAGARACSLFGVRLGVSAVLDG